MAKILFIGGALDGRTQRICGLRDQVRGDARMPGPFCVVSRGAEPPKKPETFWISTYTRRKFTDGREVFALDTMTDEEVAAQYD